MSGTSSPGGPPGLGRHRGKPQPPWARWASPLGRGALGAIAAVVLLVGLVVVGAVLVAPGHDPAADETAGSDASTRSDGGRGVREPSPTAASSSVRGGTRSAPPGDPSGAPTRAPQPSRSTAASASPAPTPPGKHHGRPAKPAGHPSPGHGATDAPGRH